MSLSGFCRQPNFSEKNVKANKKVFSNELAYIIAIISLAFGTALMEATDFGVSMVVAPAYILHLKISQLLPFFSFGMAEYSLQAVLLLATAVIVRRFKISYLFSFVTAVLYGFTLDGFMLLVAYFPPEHLAARIAFYSVGTLFSCFGVALFFRTYISPEAYELFVKEVSSKYNVDIHKFKICYDITSCALSIVLSFLFFGLWHFEGVNVGTIVCALSNGLLISLCSKSLDRFCTFADKLPLRPYFEK